MNAKLKFVAIGAVALLAIAGLTAVMLPPVSATDEVSEVAVLDEEVMNGTHNLTINVVGKVDGQRMSLQGANISVCTVNITKEDNRTVIVIEKIAEGITDANGTVVLNLEQNKYCVLAEYHGLYGFARGNLTEDENVQVNIHTWQAECQHGNAWKKVLIRDL